MMRFHVALLFAALLLVVAETVRAAEVRRPNIVIFFAADDGYGDLGCYHRVSHTREFILFSGVGSADPGGSMPCELRKPTR